MPWNLEPHVAKRVFLAMLLEAMDAVGTRPGAERAHGGHEHSQHRDNSWRRAHSSVFIDASYEGDLMARTGRVTSTWGREARAMYNESALDLRASATYPMAAFGVMWIPLRRWPSSPATNPRNADTSRYR